MLIFSLSLLQTSSAIAKQQVLRLLVWEGYAPQPERELFQNYILEKYGMDLKLEVTYIARAEDCFTALRLKKADILSPAHNRINDKRFRMIDLGLLLPLDLNNIPNYRNLYPSFKALDHLTDEGEHYGAPFAWGPYGLVYNTERFATPPSSWNSLWDPRYRGQFSIADYGEINIYITALALGYAPEALADFDQLNTTEFKQKLSDLVTNAQSLWVGVDTADDLQGLSLGTSWGFALPGLKRRGETWKWADPREGAPGWIDNHVISHTLKDKPKLKRIAEEWINFTISPAFQAKVLIEALGTQPVNSRASTLLTDEQIEEFNLNDPDYFKNKFILMPKLGRRARNGMNILWQEAIQKQITARGGDDLAPKL